MLFRSLVRKDSKLWQTAIAQHQYAVDWLIDRYKTILDIESGQGKREFTDVVLKVIRGLEDKVEQDHFVAELAKLIGVSKDAMVAKLNEQQTSEKPVRLKKAASPAHSDSKEVIERRKTEQHILSLLLLRPGLRKTASSLSVSMFTDQNAAQLFAFLQKHPAYKGEASASEELQSIQDYVKITVLQFEELYRNLEHIELSREVARLQERLVALYVKEQKVRVRKAMETASEEDMRKLIEADKRLNNLLKQTKEQ